MREKIAEIIKPYLFLNYKDAYSISYDVEEIADKVLALLPSLEGIAVESICSCEIDSQFDGDCGICHGTGIITRQATKGEIEWFWNIAIQGCISCEGRLLPLGGRLKIREKY